MQSARTHGPGWRTAHASSIDEKGLIYIFKATSAPPRAGTTGMPEDMPDRMSNRMSEDMSDRMPEDLPVRKCINVMVGITRSKVFFFKKTCYIVFHII